jgi:hypothetical protein
VSDDTRATLSELSRNRLAEVHPELRRRVENLSDALAAENIFIQVSMAVRTAAMQDDLFARGRTIPGKIVTNARAYQSNHVIGCAVDVFPEDYGENPDWNANDPSWQRIVALAPTFGLRDGKSWHDLPHLELVEIPTEPTEAIQQLCRTEGVSAVWMELAIPTFGT